MPDAADPMVDGAPPPVEVEIFTFRYAVLSPLSFVAVQDGDGPWQLLESHTGHYQFLSQTGRYGIATVCESAGLSTVELVFATAAEQSQSFHHCYEPQ